MSVPRICVIGAGPAGLSTLIQLKFRQEEGCGPFDIVCFETQSTWGGVWNYTWRTGLDEFGEKVHAAMYNDLWTNAPFEVNEYPDYTLLDHFKRPYQSHPPRAACRDYMEGRWKKYDVKKFIQFNTSVRNVTFDEETNKFTVVSEKLINREKITEEFDYVVVCASYPSTPFTPPEIQGFKDIESRAVHSHDLRNEFRNGAIKDKKILIIGGKYSAEDIALQCQKFGASEVHMAYNRAPLGYVPAHEHPPVDHFEGPRTAHFQDGSKTDFDLVIFSTGYVLNYPFMEDKLRIHGKTLFYQDNLYKSCVWLKGGHNRLFYIGTCYPLYTITLSEAEAVLTSKIIAKTVDLPSMEEMQQDVKHWLEIHDKVVPRDMPAYSRFQTSVLNDITATAKFEFSLDAQKILDRSFACRMENLSTHRDQTYESLHTKTVSIVPDIPFMQNFNDNLEDFLKSF